MKKLLYLPYLLLAFACKQASQSSHPSIQPDSLLEVNLDTLSVVDLTTKPQEDKALELMEKLKSTYDTVLIDKTTYYITEGDIIMDADELYFYCLKRLTSTKKDYESTQKSGQLTVGVLTSGEYAVWRPGQVIKYTILRQSFNNDADYHNVVSNMGIATKDWMKACNIKFQYVPALDNTSPGSTLPDDITFCVRKINSNGKFIAMAFFPGDPPYKRKLYLDPQFFTMNESKAGVLRHELGHVLGFRHEHIWSQASQCKGENIIENYLGATAQTQYDCFSVMHYLCGGCGTLEMNLTSFDIEGAQKIYGAPVNSTAAL